jgi:spore germination protein KA
MEGSLDHANKPISVELEQTCTTFLSYFPQAADLIQRDMIIQPIGHLRATLFYIDGLVDPFMIQQSIMNPFSRMNEQPGHLELKLSCLVSYLHQSVLTNGDGRIITTFDEALRAVLAGDTVIFIDQCSTALVIKTIGAQGRSVEEPSTEPVIRGPRDGFTENININTALVRRRLQTSSFCLETLTIGETSNTRIQIAYIHGIVKEGLVDEVKDRLQRIQIDAVLESGYIEELIEDAPFSPFVTVQSTERPDKVAASLLEGRAAIFVDNTPFVLIVPGTFWQYIQASDDYYSRYMVGSFFRMIRLSAFIISLTLPSVYVMIVSFHQEMVPTLLALTIAAGREVVPLPVLIEILLMELAFELMREAGLRMPRPIGSAVSIVGSLVIGQAAVQAGIFGPFAVIIVAVTGIASFAIPNYATSFSIRILRFPLLIASGTVGLLGFGAAIMLLLLHLLSLRSFGEPYFSPLSPFRPSEQKDIIIRSPWWAMRKRPLMAQGDPNRMSKDLRPSPKKGK